VLYPSAISWCGTPLGNDINASLCVIPPGNGPRVVSPLEAAPGVYIPPNLWNQLELPFLFFSFFFCCAMIGLHWLRHEPQVTQAPTATMVINIRSCMGSQRIFLESWNNYFCTKPWNTLWTQTKTSKKFYLRKKLCYDFRNYLLNFHTNPYIYHHTRSVSLGDLWFIYLFGSNPYWIKEARNGDFLALECIFWNQNFKKIKFKK